MQLYSRFIIFFGFGIHEEKLFKRFTACFKFPPMSTFSEDLIVRCENLERKEIEYFLLLFLWSCSMSNRSRIQESFQQFDSLLTLTWIPIKKCVAMRLGDKWLTEDQQEAGRLPVRGPPPPLHSYWPHGSHIWLPAGQNTQKYHHKHVDALAFRLKNRLKQDFLCENL